MKLYKRENGIWYVDAMVNGKRMRTSTGKTDKTSAAKAAIDLITAAKEIPAKSAVPTLGSAIERLLRERYEGTKSYKSYAVASATALLEHLGRTTPLDQALTSLERLVGAHKQRGNTPATTNRYLAFAKVLADTARDNWGVLPEGFNSKKITKHRQREYAKTKQVYTRGQEQSILRFFETHSLESFRATGELLTVLFDTGCRLSEVLTRRKKHLLLHAANLPQVLHVTDTKGGKERMVPLGERSGSILKRRSLEIGSNDLLFGDINFDTVQRCWKRMKKVMDAEGITGWTIHGIRHTTATRLMQSGANLRIVQQLLGHANISTTAIYAHVMIDDLADAMEKLHGSVARCAESMPKDVTHLQGQEE